jgi:hypothetical protein
MNSHIRFLWGTEIAGSYKGGTKCPNTIYVMVFLPLATNSGEWAPFNKNKQAVM